MEKSTNNFFLFLLRVNFFVIFFITTDFPTHLTRSEKKITLKMEKAPSFAEQEIS